MMVYQRNGAHSIFAIELIEYHLQVLIHVLCVSGNFEEFFFLYRSVVDDWAQFYLLYFLMELVYKAIKILRRQYSPFHFRQQI